MYVQRVPRPGEGEHSFQSPRGGLRTTILELRTFHLPQSPAQPSGTLSTPLLSTSTAWLRDPKGQGGPDAGPCSSYQEQHFSRGPPAQGPHPTSTEQTSCHRCHLAWQHPGKPSWVFIIKSRLPKRGFPKAVTTAHPLWEGTLLPPWADEMPQGSLPIGGMEAAPCAPLPARAAPTRAPAFRSC